MRYSETLILASCLTRPVARITSDGLSLVRHAHLFRHVPLLKVPFFQSGSAPRRCTPIQGNTLPYGAISHPLGALQPLPHRQAVVVMKDPVIDLDSVLDGEVVVEQQLQPVPKGLAWAGSDHSER